MRPLALLVLLLLPGCAAPPRQEIDLGRAADEAVALLQELVRFDTINPPPPGSPKRNADETALLRHVARVLAADGIAAEIFEAEPGRGNLVARWRGSGADRPVLLAAHVDVVGVDRPRWDVDPLSGEIRDGLLWGRGALDDKDDAAVFVEVLRLLARSGTRLRRDVILMLNADEESSGRLGAKYMVEKHWDRIDCEFVLNEGGTAMLRDGKVALFGFETAEKVYNDFRLYVRGESGHSSVPGPKNAIYDAARLLARLETFRTPVRLTPTTSATLLGLAGAPEYAASAAIMKRAAAGDPAAAQELCENPRFNAQLRSTFVPTLVKGGIRENVLPPDVEINFNARLLPGDSIDQLVKSLMAHLGISAYEVVEGDAAAVESWKKSKRTVDTAVFLVDRGLDAPASSADTAMFRALARAGRKLSPQATVIPRMSTGATDSRFFRARGVESYGISPCPTGEGEDRTPHDHNERVRVESVGFGVRFVLETLLELAK